jgi:hypothetical protein
MVGKSQESVHHIFLRLTSKDVKPLWLIVFCSGKQSIKGPGPGVVMHN